MPGIAATDQGYAGSRPTAPNAGNLFAATGDSITASNSSRQNNTWGDSWSTYAALASGGKLAHLYTCAQGGYTTAQIDGIFQTEVLQAGLKNRVLLIGGGTNDTDGVSDTLPNLETQIRAGLARGQLVALQTIPPAGMQALGAPAGFTATPDYTGGTLAAGTYYYQIQARGTYGSGVTSTEISVTLTGVGRVQFSWTPLGGATGYVIWGRGTGNAGKTGYAFINGTGTAQSTPQSAATDTGAALSASTMPTTDASANNTNTTVTRTKLTRVNNAIHRLADRYGLPVVDHYGQLVDWANSGQYKANYTADGTHPVPKIQRLMGVNVANTLAPYLPPRMPYFAGDMFDPTVLGVPAGGIIAAGTTMALLPPNSASGYTRPSNWSWYGATTDGSTTTLATDPNVLGYVYTVNRSSWQSTFTDFGITTGFAVGDRISFACKVKSSGLDAIEGGSLTLGLKCPGSSGAQYITALQLTRDVPTTSLPGGWAIWYGEAVVPPGTTQLLMVFYALGQGVSVSIAQPTIRNLTALGIA